MAQAADEFFASESKGEFIVKYKGETLIGGESVSLLPNGFSSRQIKTFNPAKTNKVIHISGCENDLEYLKELSGSKSSIELNILFRTMPGTSTKLDYFFKVPADFLKGCKYKALIGSTSSSKWITGTFSNENMDNVRFLSIEGPGKNLYIDLDPAGVMNHYGAYSGAWGYEWHVYRSGDFYQFGFTVSGKPIGYSEMKKVIIGQGPVDYKTIHPIQQKGYTEALPVEYFVSFGGSSAIGSSVPFRLGVFSEKTKFGWAKNYENVGFHSSGFKGPICGQYAAGTGQVDFKFKVLPGRYILSLTFGSASQPLGPFDISINGTKKAKKVTSDKGSYLSIPVNAVADGDELTVTLSGNWAVSSLILQPYLFKTEDYIFDRNWWVVEDGVPDYAKKQNVK